MYEGSFFSTPPFNTLSTSIKYLKSLFSSRNEFKIFREIRTKSPVERNGLDSNLGCPVHLSVNSYATYNVF